MARTWLAIPSNPRKSFNGFATRLQFARGRALWAMATSSWAEQFAGVARQWGDEARGVREAEAIFAATPELRRAAPALYEIRVGESVRTCHRRSACCLYFKSATRYFCASCPIIAESERLERNRSWVAQQILPKKQVTV